MSGSNPVLPPGAPAAPASDRDQPVEPASESALIESDIERYLERYQRKELLRFVAVGSVDDGKSTLIGRLLHDTQGIYDDQLAQVQRASAARGMTQIDFSLFTDGLKAEREQGITIDVAYRYFATERRKFIIADTPGHVQYTRNMVTGASTADVCLILIDARLGVLQQSRRHAYIASLLGIPHLAVCVNKMDLVGYDPQVFADIRQQFAGFAGTLGFQGVTFLPISALEGDNVVRPSPHTPWHTGPTVLGYLETVPVGSSRNRRDFRYPVQHVLRPNLDYRAFAGQIASGRVRTGDPVLVFPSGKRSRISAIDTHSGAIPEGFAPMSVALRLADEIDISRGDMLVHPDNLPTVGRTFDAHLVWMSERPLDRQKSYILKHTTQSVRAQVDSVQWKVDMDTLAQQPTATLALNDIARVTLSCRRALYFDPYQRNRATGAFILIDSLSNNTVAAGMILASDQEEAQDLEAALKEGRAGSALSPRTQVSPRERRERMGQSGVTVWLAGRPGSGRWSLAYALERRLFDLGRTATVVTPQATGEAALPTAAGDAAAAVARPPGRETLHAMAAAARACTDAGLVTVCAFDSKHRTERQHVRQLVGPERFFVVHVNTSEALCRERRPDVDWSDFEPPQAADITVALDHVETEEAVEVIISALEARGCLERDDG
jgi:bifunctional enzyme CysN/CysC